MQTTTHFQPCSDQLCWNHKTQQINMLCACEYMLPYQQVFVLKPFGLTNQLEIHKSQKSCSNGMGTKQLWVYTYMNGRL